MGEGEGINLKALHCALIGIYEEIRKICERHQIRFYGSSGTVIGAMRHGGFIPWDDDLDLEMPRTDYERFRQVVEEELPAGLRFLSWQNTYGYDYLFGKVQCTDPDLVSKVERESGLELTQGLYVDIFISDYFPRSRIGMASRIVRRGLLKVKQYALLGKFGNVFGNILTRSIYTSLRTYLDCLRRDDEIAGSCPVNKAGTMGNSAWFQVEVQHYKGKRFITPDDFGSMRYVPFEDTQMPVPHNADNYLKGLYGDWRKLPPEDKRVPAHGDGVMVPWRLGYVSLKQQPLLSIVIANYNYGRFIEEAITSVVSQCWGVAKGPRGQLLLGLPDGNGVELIVCDGGSTDNSIEIVKKYSKYLTWWCSEKDNGQSDAFNKGFSHATGRFLTWLNADDVLIPGTLERLSNAVCQHPQQEWFIGGCIWADRDMRIVRCTRARKVQKRVADCGYVPVYSPSSFFSRRLLEKAGGVNVDFHYKMDTLLWLQFYHDFNSRAIPLPGYCFVLRMHEATKVSGIDFCNKAYPEQMRRETEILNARWPRRKIPRFAQLLSLDCYKLISNLMDTSRLKGVDFNSIRSKFK